MANRKKKGRWGTRCAILLCIAVAAAVIWNQAAPTVTAASVIRYTPYTVESQDIPTAMNFGGVVSILHSQGVSVSESTTVREVYVQSAQAVRKGDKLLQMESGEVLTASIDGVINQLRAREGGWAIEGMTLVQVCDLENMQISMSVDEYDISKIHIGQPCTVYILSLGLTFTTEIAHVNRVSLGDGTVARYTVSIELTVPETVLPGMQASVTIPQETAMGAVALPVEAVSYDEENQPYVYTASGSDSYQETPVVLGVTDGMYVQILQGLQPGEIAYRKETVEQAQEGFSLENLYKKVFGETIVVNESQQGRGGRRGVTDDTSSSFNPEDSSFPEGFTFPDGAEPPDGAPSGSPTEAAVQQKEE